MVRGWLQRPEKSRLPRRRAIIGRSQGRALEQLEERRMLAATLYTVNSTSNSTSGSGTSGTLPYVITAINGTSNADGYDVTFSNLFNTAQTITLGAALDVTQTTGKINITGTDKTKVTIDGDMAYQVFHLANGVDATLADVTIKHGSATNGAGIYVGGGMLTLTDVNVSHNVASDRAGGLFDYGGKVIISDGCSITSNTGSTSGGGIYADSNGTVTVVNSDVSHNTAGYGGGIFLNTGTLTVVGGSVAHNTADYGAGGGIYDYGGKVKIIGTCSVTHNSASIAVTSKSGGGGIRESGDGTVTISNSTVAHNVAGYGGGVLMNGGSLTIIGGALGHNHADYGGGGIYDYGGELRITGSASVTNNSVTGPLSGGAILELDGTVTISDSKFTSNSAKYGGGIFLYGGSLTITHGMFSLNMAEDGGGIYARSGTAATKGSVKITDSCTFTSNSATNQGGALDVRTGATATVTNSAISKNTAKGTGGGVYIDGGKITLEFSAISGNKAEYGGGGIYDYGGKVVISGSCSLSSNSTTGGIYSGGAISGLGGASITIDNSTFSKNSAAYGGAVSVFGGSLTIELSYFSGNTATDYGGAVAANTTANVVIKSGCSFSGNTAGTSGGAIYVSDNVILSISGSTVKNSSAEYGGGIYVQKSALTLTASTVSDNTASISGGGLLDYDTSTAALVNDTFANNSAADYGGGIAVGGSELTAINVTVVDNTVAANSVGGAGLAETSSMVGLANTIVALNTHAGDVPDDIGGSVVGAYNLIGIGGSGGLVNGTDGNQVGVTNLYLGQLAQNGGPTETIAVLPGSPAIGTGSHTIPSVTVPTVDERGVARPANSVDVGAYQDRGFVYTTAPGSSPQYTPVNKAFTVPLSVVVTSPYGDPVAGGVLTFTAPGSGASAVLSAETATIGANGEATVGATANGTGGTYKVSAAIGGKDAATVYFTLTNTTQNVVSALSIGWGIKTIPLQVLPSSGGVMFSSGRNIDLPWEGINQFLITFSQSQQIRSSGVTITSALGLQYGPVIVNGANKSFQIILGRAINEADKVTISVTNNSGNLVFNGTIYVLPGDFNDDGVVTMTDANDIRNEWLGLKGARPTIAGDINGDGYVNGADYYLTLAALGTTLPSSEPSVVLGSSGGRGSAVVKIGATPPATTSQAVAAPATATRGTSATDPSLTRPSRRIVADRLRPRAELELSSRGRKMTAPRH